VPPSQSDEQKKRQEELLALLLALRKAMAAALTLLLLQFGRNEITPQQFGDDALKLLADYNSQAAALGRELGGADEAGDSDAILGEAVAYEQASYLAGFVNDIEDGKYGPPGAIDEEAIGKRSLLYADRLVGTANTAWVNFLSVGTLIYWLDAGGVNECSDCEALALGSPYKPEELPTTPGSGGTACMFNCRCNLQTDHGDKGFQWPEEDD